MGASSTSLRIAGGAIVLALLGPACGPAGKTASEPPRESPAPEAAATSAEPMPSPEPDSDAQGEEDRMVLEARPPSPPAIIVPAPPLAPQQAKPRPGLKASLKQRSRARNKIVDDEPWFAKHELNLGVTRPTPDSLPAEWLRYEEIPLSLIFPGQIFHHRGSGRDLVVLRGAQNQVEAALDISSFKLLSGQDGIAKPIADEWNMDLRWVARDGDTVYLSHAHRTYAKTTGGKNAYLTALTSKGELLWRSQPLTCNAATFVVLEEVIVCGYGFTAEPDFLYLIDRQTGATHKKLKVRSGPEYILRKANDIYVRTYDTDYVFEIEP